MKTILYILLAFFILFVPDWGFLNGSITEYGIQCPKDFKEGNGCYTLGTTTYYPNKNNQTVISKNEFTIATLKKCSVIDRKNWECKFNDESATFGFNNGSFHNTSLSNKLRDVTFKELLKDIEEYRYVPRYIWLLESFHII